MAPTPTAFAASTITFPTVAPMTTIWTPPASCFSQTPYLFGGTCNSNGCLAYAKSDIITSWYAWINGGYWTTSDIQVETECAPPSTQRVVGFSYSPARGCPLGYKTVSASTLYYNLDVSVICCPSDYPRLETFRNGDIQCWRYMTTPETMSVLAIGDIYSTNSAGYTTDTYMTTSPISTTVAAPTASGTTLWVFADAIQMVVPSAWAASTFATPTTTYNPYTDSPTATNDGSSGPNFHLGPLSFAYSIVVLVAGGIFVLAVLCCCFRCCRRRPIPVPSPYVRRESQPRPDPSPSPYVWSEPLPRPDPLLSPPPPIFQPKTEPYIRPSCSHDLGSNCRSSVRSCCCCAGADKRPPPMTREDRVSTYCIFCRLYWAAVPASMCPTEWELLCAHKRSCEADPETSCCSCCDKRSWFMDLDFRVKDYCPPCRRKWEIKPPADWPRVWGKPPVIPTPKPIPIPTPSLRKPIPQDRRRKDKNKSDIELITISAKSAEKGPEVQILEADDEKGKYHEEKGPQYSEPQFFNENDPNPRPAAIGEKAELLQAIKSVDKTDGATFSQFSGEAVLHDQGPTYTSTPNLQVSPDQPGTTAIATTKMTSPAIGPSASLMSAESSRSSTPMSKTEKQREKERKGLQYQAPRFSVLPGGRLAEDGEGRSG